MHVLLGKKQIVLAALVVALGLAVFVNWYYSSTGTEIFPEGAANSGENVSADVPDGQADFVGNSDDGEYFASVRLTRDTAHAQALDELQTVLTNASEDSDAAARTAEAIEELTGVIKMESDIEGLVNGRTGSPCVAVISDNSVDIIVPSAQLTDMNVLAISDVVNEICGKKYENVKISGAVG